jgi:hypothetical protein
VDFVPLRAIKSNKLEIKRQLARKTLLWFLHYLKYLKNVNIKNKSTSTKLPSRGDILAFLDLESKKKRDSIRYLVNNLPVNFLNVKNWID